MNVYNVCYYLIDLVYNFILDDLIFTKYIFKYTAYQKYLLNKDNCCEYCTFTHITHNFEEFKETYPLLNTDEINAIITKCVSAKKT